MADYTNGHTNGNGNGNGYGNGRTRRPSDHSPSVEFDKLPPQNLEAELCVLGSVLLDNDTLHEVVPLIRVEDFYRDSHQIIYRAIRDLYDLGKGIDAITLVEELSKRGEFEKAGGDDAIRKILEAPPHAANAKYYAQIVRQKSISRELIDGANQMLRDGYSNSFTADELLQSAERRIFAISEDQAAGETIDIKDVIVNAMDRITARAEDRHAVTGIASGYYDLDDITGGFQGTQLIILAARPSMGKTALALNICEHVICELKKAVLFVSLEMGELELVDRLLSSRARVDGYKLKTGKGLGQQDMIQLGQAYTELQRTAMSIDSTPARNMLQITANARRLKLRQDLGMIVVDYIQLIDAEESRDSRQEQIAKISRRLKQLARELKIPVIALSQLNRAVENREDRRPRMADLRESGAIEQDADLVLLLHRPEYYNADDQPRHRRTDHRQEPARERPARSRWPSSMFARFENLAQIADPLGGAF